MRFKSCSQTQLIGGNIVPDFESFFVRHTKGLHIGDEELDRLWRERRIAIHYPGVEHTRDQDNDSLDLSTYLSKYRRKYKVPFETFQSLEKNGGYVWAEYRKTQQYNARVIAGIIRPQRYHRWSTKYASWSRRSGNPAMLKTLQFDEAVSRDVATGENMALRAMRPRLLTIAKWKIVKSRLALLINKEDLSEDDLWSNLFPAQQETACAEFLREQKDSPELPRLRRLLLPVGRTLEDIDIYGYSTNDR